MQMRAYNPYQPLIFIHVPKTAGTSVRSLFAQLFPGRVHHHYCDESAGSLPPKRNLNALCQNGLAPILFGHFNENRGFGIREYYPHVTQFVTILRDPFEMHLSRYFYTKRRQKDWQRTSDVGDTGLRQFIEEGHLNMMEHFPRDMTLTSFETDLAEQFVDVGCVETLSSSVSRITARLGATMDDMTVPMRNQSERELHQDLAPLRILFRERWPLEHAIYDYARRMNLALARD
ncbi:hypothetical protein [Tateyamaria sp. SN6-1]|uniref:hypothetical protein n=1 Tax=Tateyamaria sp. SN6-1 TaxID=3092148 RepID=UPI0039F5B0CD